MGALKFYTVSGRLKMVRGDLASPVLAYETWGEISAARDNAVLIFTGLSPSAHVASSSDDPSNGWWEDMVGPDKPIDTNRYFVVCMNSLGSCFGSTGPASVNPETGQHYRLKFPVLCLEDIANAAARLLDHLDIPRVHTVLGASMGGMTALAFTLLQPDRAAGLISISAAARSLPFSIAIRSVQREMIRRDPAWLEGTYDFDAPPSMGMQLARKLGMISYRSAAEWTQRFGRERATNHAHPTRTFGIDFEVESYLEAHAKKFVGTFDANCYLYLSRAMDLFDVANYGGSVSAGLQRIRGVKRALVIGVDSDFLFPAAQQEELATGLDDVIDEVTFQRLESIQGHDSFLVDMDRFRPAVASFF